MQGVPVFFLDIDGVLLPFGEGVHHTTFPDSTLHALSFILSHTEGRLVLSSTWRVIPDARTEIIDNFRQFAATHGGPLGDILKFDQMTSLSNHSHRQWEIHEWLCSQAGKGIEHWVALDDEELLSGAALAQHRPAFEGHVVKCESHLGLTMEQAHQAVLLAKNRTRKGNLSRGKRDRSE